MAKAEKVVWTGLHVDDLTYIANVLRKYTDADVGPVGLNQHVCYIAAETPKTPIWREVEPSRSRVLLGHVVKEDLGYWTFEPSSPKTQPEEYS